MLLEELGVGGMGVVYTAYDPELDRKVALKLLRSAGNEEARARLYREAQTLAKLAHPNVVGVHDVGFQGGEVFVAMEFVPGQTLRAVFHAEKAWEKRLEALVGAGRGLVAAHELGIVHRDFKPDNVLVAKNGLSRVLDFGLAQAKAEAQVADPAITPAIRASGASAPAVHSIAGSVSGTPGYMAPEQYLGLPSDPRTDQFAFGAEGVALLRQQLPLAESVGHRATLAALLVELGSLERLAGEAKVAEVTQKRAMAEALGANDREAMALGCLGLAQTIGDTLGRPAEGMPYTRWAQGTLDGLPSSELLQAQKDAVTANLYFVSGEAAEAEKAFRHAYELRRKKLGERHLDTGIALAGIGIALFQQSKIDEAIQAFERALVIYLAVLGPNHPRVASLHNNLAIAIGTKGDLKGELKHQQRALEINEKTLGAEHQDVALSLANLAAVLSPLGRIEEALAASERATAMPAGPAPGSAGALHPGHRRAAQDRGRPQLSRLGAGKSRQHLAQPRARPRGAGVAGRVGEDPRRHGGRRRGRRAGHLADAARPYAPPGQGAEAAGDDARAVGEVRVSEGRRRAQGRAGPARPAAEPLNFRPRARARAWRPGRTGPTSSP